MASEIRILPSLNESDLVRDDIEVGYIEETGRYEVIVKYSGDILRLESELNVDVEVLSENYAIITLLKQQIDSLYDFPEIEYIELPKRIVFMLSESRGAVCVTQVQSQTNYNLDGEGTIVGILDSGIDYRHQDFRNPDGTSRILYIWDQTAKGVPPVGFKEGVEYTKQQIDGVLSGELAPGTVPMEDYVGHGTAVAGVAAGNGSSSNGIEKGMAPNASLIVVKLGERGRQSFSRTTELMRAIKYVYDKALMLKMPLSVNISYGTNDGAHDGRSLFESYIDEMSQKWKTVISVATGNEGSAAHHFEGRISTGGEIDAEFVTAPNLSSMFVAFWKDFVDDFSMELITPNGSSTGLLNYTTPTRRINTEGATIDVYYGQPTQYNSKQEIFFYFEAKDNPIPTGLWILKIRGLNVTNGRFNIWLPTVEEVSSDTAFSRPSPEISFTLPSTSHNVVTVGGYSQNINTAVSFSGRGYISENIYIKPDLVAPAIGVISTRNGGGYDSFRGTSMAAPFVAGASALIMQWGIVRGNDPFLYGQRVKAFLRKGARRQEGIEYPNTIWGYGSLCIKDTMDEIVRFVYGG